jgi:hypothetical protein
MVTRSGNDLMAEVNSPWNRQGSQLLINLTVDLTQQSNSIVP